ncbi:exocyst complex component sec8 [Crepidotus variabilis]|uniref:Exocyst complex component Sec8 n=1 Tax=Crepidotus variabilis TaxID=179855 RepID=A0A9P6JPG1_9AGAR|nr:exocyst complex component sec8 [Crepidotus variabilis]
MSRAPPFPTRRRSPSATNGNPYASQPSSAPGTSGVRPLQVRSGSRPTTPVNSNYQYTAESPSSYLPPPSTAPLNPTRPARSERRIKPEYNGSDDRSSLASQDLYRDSVATTQSADLGYRTVPNSANRQPNGTSSRQQPQRLKSPTQDSIEDTTSPTSLNSALSAFRSAGTKRRQTQDDDDYQYHREREAELEAERERQRRIRERAPGMRTQGRRRGEIDAVLDQVRDGWEFVIDPNFNHVDLALQLLDESALGKDMESFRNTKNMLSKALRGSVDQHYQAFASSLPHHSSLQTHLTAAQAEITSARTALQEAKEALGSKRTDLVQLWNRGQMLEEMIKLLDQIEHLKTVPDLLETLMSEKRLLQAAILLVRSLKIINKSDMQEIGAVADLRSYLEAQETALRDILIDEMQSHLYLKSFWCESRWAAYQPGQLTFPTVRFEGEPIANSPDDPTSPLSPSFRQTRLVRYLNNLGLRPNEPPFDVNDTTLAQGNLDHGPSSNSSTSAYLANNANPEADSFAYLETLLESLAVLGKLGNALDSISQRLPSEIFSLVESTLDEVEERAEFVKRKSVLTVNGGLNRSEGTYLFASGHSTTAIPISGMKTAHLKASTLRLSALESLAKRVDHEIIKDLFWTLYSKFDAVAQGLRVVTEVSNRIGSRKDYKDSSGAKPGMLFPLPEIWSHVQAEVRTLIQDYLTDEQQGTAGSRNPISSINEVLRDGKFNRDRIKPVFRFSDTDLKVTNKALKPHEDGLTRILKDTMPGLAPGAAGDNAQTIVSSITDDRLMGNDQHHRLLIRPDAFHVTVLFQPTLTFLQQVAEVLPPSVQAAQASSAVLDEFVLKVYLPQLEEKVLDLFHDAVTGPEAFQSDPSSLKLVSEPLAKASTHLMALINSLSAMLNTSPFHRENYSRLILAVVIQFYQRCSDRFQSLTTRPPTEIDPDSRVALAAQWAQRSELHPCVSELMTTQASNRLRRQQLYKKEADLELSFIAEQTVSKDDLISSTRNLAALASLQRSVAWFAAELNTLRAQPIEPSSALSPVEPPTGLTPAVLTIAPEPILEHLSLPLSKEMGLRFGALLKTYEQLANLILDTIRLDIRCRTIHYLDASMRNGTYDSNYEAAEPDPYIVDLNTELVHCNEAMTVNLPKAEREYLFTGLSHLMEHMLITSARHLRKPNDFGVKKILRNVLALQQGVKSLMDDPRDAEFERAKEYFVLFFMGPQKMLETIRKKQSFSFQEYQTMLSLQCGVDPRNSGTQSVDRNYSMYMIDLHGLNLDSEK